MCTSQRKRNLSQESPRIAHVSPRRTERAHTHTRAHTCRRGRERETEAHLSWFSCWLTSSSSLNRSCSIAWKRMNTCMHEPFFTATFCFQRFVWNTQHQYKLALRLVSLWLSLSSSRNNVRSSICDCNWVKTLSLWTERKSKKCFAQRLFRFYSEQPRNLIIVSLFPVSSQVANATTNDTNDSFRVSFIETTSSNFKSKLSIIPPQNTNFNNQIYSKKWRKCQKKKKSS